MGRPKKNIINERSHQVKYELGHRSCEDPLFDDGRVPQRVLCPLGGNLIYHHNEDKEEYDDNNNKGLKDKRTVKQKKNNIYNISENESKIRKIAAETFGFPDDGYDYTRHIRPIGVFDEANFIPIKIKTKITGTPSRLRNFLDSIGDNVVTLPNSLNFINSDDKDIIIINSTTTTLEEICEDKSSQDFSEENFKFSEDTKDVLRALDDENAIVDDDNESIDNFFAAIVNNSSSDSDNDDDLKHLWSDSDDDINSIISESNNNNSESFSEDNRNFNKILTNTTIADKLRAMKITNLAPSHCSMSSSVLTRSRNQQLIDSRFDEMDKIYSLDKVGDGPVNNQQLSTENKALFNNPQIKKLMNEYLKMDANMDAYKYFDTSNNVRNPVIEKIINTQKSFEKFESIKEEKIELLNYENQLLDNYKDDDQHKYNSDGDDIQEQKWDCMSVLTSYTNTENHPGVLSTPRTRKPKTKKVFVPEINLTDKALNSINQKSAEKEEYNMMIKYLVPGSRRPRDETPEERKERRQYLKTQRHSRRQERKTMTQAFKVEKNKLLDVVASRAEGSRSAF